MTLHKFKNANSRLTVDTVRKNIDYNGTLFPITNIHVYSEAVGKIETDEYIIKWSKKKMYLYDKLWSIILLEIMDQDFDTFNSDDTVKTENDNQEVSEPSEVHVVITKYIINRNWFISHEKLDDKHFIKSRKRENEQSEFEINIYPVIKTMGRGIDMEYQTPNGILTVCKKKNCKWNGIPMGIDHS